MPGEFYSSPDNERSLLGSMSIARIESLSGETDNIQILAKLYNITYSKYVLATREDHQEAIHSTLEIIAARINAVTTQHQEQIQREINDEWTINDIESHYNDPVDDGILLAEIAHEALFRNPQE